MGYPNVPTVVLTDPEMGVATPLLGDSGSERASESYDRSTTPPPVLDEGLGSPLEQTLDKIGMGWYQKKLFVLCGLGWLADNMWLQGVAVILPRVQEGFQISDRWIGVLSTSIFTGMLIGASGWGAYSDSRGRVPAFNLTLVVTSVFGVAAALAPSFLWLCVALLGVGVGVGGSMPTDGTLFLENIPKSSASLLTGLSVFFSFGAVLTSLLGYVILPTASPERGWRYMLSALAAVSIGMVVCRVLFFRLLESPKWMVSVDNPEGAVIALRKISAINGEPVQWRVEDVLDRPYGGHPVGAATEPGATFVQKLRNGLEETRERVEELLQPEWRLTSQLVWVIWFAASTGYTMFNVFLPKWLEEKVGGSGSASSTLSKTLRDYILYTAAGIPGSIVAAYLVDTKIGRKGTMALSTLATAGGTVVFAWTTSQAGVVLSTMFVSLWATLMYAVIYSYTPEVFESHVRGTACGIAAALSRLAGILAPLVTGWLLSVSTALPLVISAGFMLATAVAMIALPIETRNR